MLGTPIEWDTNSHEKAVKFVGILHKTIERVEKDETVQKVIIDALTMHPDQLEDMNDAQINKYLIALPQGLMYLQDKCNRAQHKLDIAEARFKDVIGNPASLLTKENFEKGTTNITTDMRLAKMREIHPKEYDELMAQVRVCRGYLIGLEGQLKHIQTLNDNLKKVRESFFRAN